MTPPAAPSVEQVASHWLGRLLFRAVVTIALACGMLWINQTKDTTNTILTRMDGLSSRVAAVEVRQAVLDALLDEWRRDMEAWRSDWREVKREPDLSRSAQGGP